MPPSEFSGLEVSYSVEELKAFLDQDSQPIISFYGGEPLLRQSLMKNIMDSVSARYVIQTNGIMLPQVESSYLNKFEAILVSIDGARTLTDYYRGTHVYDQIMTAVSDIRNRGYHGDLIARMTVSEETDIYDAVYHLLTVKDSIFDHVHWQLNVFWAPDGSWKDYDMWLTHSYLPGLSKLIELWITEMENHKRILGIVPFINVMYSLLLKQPSKLRCGSGIDAFAIATSGRIIACPICPEYESMHVGHIQTSSPDSLRNTLPIEGPCLDCEIFTLCGGRCLFVNRIPLWTIEEFQKICITVKHLIRELQSILPRIEVLISKGDFSLDDFNYPSFNNGCEIIP